MEGDANTSYFHMSANGRKRKKTIVSLEHEGVIVTNQDEITDSYLVQRRKKEYTYQEMRGVTLAV